MYLFVEIKNWVFLCRDWANVRLLGPGEYFCNQGYSLALSLIPLSQNRMGH
jgi:hypothetical protein